MVDAQQPALTKSPTNKLALAQITPETARAPAFLEGVVSLQWPFSPSNATLSLLVCEEDFRLRSNRGQLRVDFRGPSARAVDDMGVQIGDRVRLSLEGAGLEQLDTATAGDVPWAVVFSARLAMQFKNTTTNWVPIDVDVPDHAAAFSAPTSSQDRPTYAPASPLPTRPPATPPPQPPAEGLWGAFRASKRKGDLMANSPLYLERLFDETPDSNLDLDLSRPRKKPRFSSAYRLVDRTPSPEAGAVGDPFVDAGPSRADAEAARLAAMTDEPLSVYRDAPSSPAGESPTATTTTVAATAAVTTTSTATVGMPPLPPPPPIHLQDQDHDDEMPDSQVAPPYLHRGLSTTDCMSIDTSERGKGVEDLELTLDAAVATDVGRGGGGGGEGKDEGKRGEGGEGGGDVEGGWGGGGREGEEEGGGGGGGGEEGKGKGKDLPMAAPAGASVGTSDGESEKDSLFDELSDREDTRPRPKSRSPLPKPSPLRKVVRAKTPNRGPTQRAKLSLQISASPSSAPQGTPLSAAAPATPRTPRLYLPTPSPKVSCAADGPGGFPFAVPPRADFGSRSAAPAPGPGAEEETPRERKRKLLRRSLNSGSSDLSTFFGRPRPPAPSAAPAAAPAAAAAATAAAAKAPAAEAPRMPEPRQVQGAAAPPPHNPSPTEFRSGITTPLSDFPPLAFLSWGNTVDVIGVVCQFHLIQRAETGPKDYKLVVRIVDSSQPLGVTMSLFRPHREALPEADVGDVVMLRSFKIISRQHRLVGTSTENSAWAVWKKHGTEPAVCAGPPVEYGDGEQGYVEAIGKWYEGLGEKARQEMEKRPKEGPPGFED